MPVPERVNVSVVRPTASRSAGSPAKAKPKSVAVPEPAARGRSAGAAGRRSTKGPGAPAVSSARTLRKGKPGADASSAAPDATGAGKLANRSHAPSSVCAPNRASAPLRKAGVPSESVTDTRSPTSSRPTATSAAPPPSSIPNAHSANAASRSPSRSPFTETSGTVRAPRTRSRCSNGPTPSPRSASGTS